MHKTDALGSNHRLAAETAIDVPSVYCSHIGAILGVFTINCAQSDKTPCSLRYNASQRHFVDTIREKRFTEFVLFGKLGKSVKSFYGGIIEILHTSGLIYAWFWTKV